MKVYVIGSGAIGSLFAGYLAEGGLNVTLVARNRKVVEAVEQNGLKIQGRRGDHTVRLPIVTEVGEDPDADLVLICVKAYDTAGAVEQHAALLKSAKMSISLQNGIGNVEEITARIGKEKVLAGSTTMGAFVISPGVVNHAGEGETTIGEIQGGKSKRAQKAADALTGAGLTTVVSENITRLLWAKLCINVAINPLTALLRVRNGVLADHETTRAIMQTAVGEAVAVAGRMGVPLDLDEMQARAVSVAEKTAKNRSSMLTDILKGKRTEIDFINGAVVRLGRKNQLAAPANELLTNLVGALENTQPQRVKNEDG